MMVFDFVLTLKERCKMMWKSLEKGFFDLGGFCGCGRFGWEANGQIRGKNIGYWCSSLP